MKRLLIKVDQLREIKKDIFLLKFKSPYLAKISKPGQFLHIKVDTNQTILRRPFSIHRVEKDNVFILFKIRGKGTRILSQYKKGNILDIIGPLGKGFRLRQQTTDNRQQTHILVAGGIGVAPLLFLGEKIRQTTDYRLQTTDRRQQMIVLLGAKSKDEILCEKDFRKLGFKVYVATEDSSRGFRGKITELLKKILFAINSSKKGNLYACGPKEMFFEIKKILKNYPQIRMQVSFEQFMGCGLGVCCGCVIETFNGYKKVCKDGPVFDLGEIK
jgi:dihydroorotate dehydrogenase electron transfer subunit